MSDGHVRLDVDGMVARITIDRPSTRNAMTLAMYSELLAACAAIASASPSVRVAVVSGVEGSFCAGTDISEFVAFAADGDDGIRYEGMIQTVLEGIEQLPVPTIAAVDGPAMGGGMLIAAACDFRVVTERARFGAPMAKTLGNLLAPASVDRLERNLGLAIARRILLLAETVDADESVSVGFALAKVQFDQLDKHIASLINQLTSVAPLTVSATRKSLAQNRAAGLSDELVRSVYRSLDFREGVSAFLEKRKPGWTGS